MYYLKLGNGFITEKGKWEPILFETYEEAQEFAQGFFLPSLKIEKWEGKANENSRHS